MGIDKIVKKLGELLSDNLDSDGRYCDDIQELLEKLEKKKGKLEKKLKDTDNVSKRKKIKLELKIVEAQLKKGHKLTRKKCP